MLTRRDKFLGLESLLVGWPAASPPVLELLSQVAVIKVLQCSATVANELLPYAFHRKSFTTSLLDLSLGEAALWQGLDPKSCRYEIRKAQKLDCVIRHNEETDAAFGLLRAFIDRNQYRAALSPADWEGLLPNHDVFLAKTAGEPIAVHVLLADPPHRARLLLSATVDRNDPRFKNVVGPVNRLLHWHEILYYQRQAVACYDFGGCDLDERSPLYPIARFKLSFGGPTVQEDTLYLAGNRLLRLALRSGRKLRSSWRGVRSNA